MYKEKVANEKKKSNYLLQGKQKAITVVYYNA